MNVTVVGTGYVGLIAGLGFAEWGHNVICLDVDDRKIGLLQEGVCPIYEPGAEEILKKCISDNRIKFTTDKRKAIEESELIFIAVGTPEDSDGNADMKYVYGCAKDIGTYINNQKVIVDKSTVPIGTSWEVKRIIQEQMKTRGVNYEVSVASNPEFLREGKAIGDFINPDRIVIGTSDEYAEKQLKKLYFVFNRSKTPIISTTPETAEMIKYASNAFLATKITFINEIANLCDKVGADVNEVARAMGNDGRISPKFLHSGPGYGGSCFPKDTKALAMMGAKQNARMTVVEAVISANQRQKKIAADKIIDNMPDGGTIAILGLAFKPETDDMREAPSITVISELLKKGIFRIKAYDPEAMDNSKKIFKDEKIEWVKSAREAISESDAVVVMTEWLEFRSLDVDELRRLMTGNKIFDFRHVFARTDLEEAGFEYYGIGF